MRNTNTFPVKPFSTKSKIAAQKRQFRSRANEVSGSVKQLKREIKQQNRDDQARRAAASKHHAAPHSTSANRHSRQTAGIRD